jgi:hypothetical protein
VKKRKVIKPTPNTLKLYTIALILATELGANKRELVYFEMLLKERCDRLVKIFQVQSPREYISLTVKTVQNLVDTKDYNTTLNLSTLIALLLSIVPNHQLELYFTIKGKALQDYIDTHVDIEDFNSNIYIFQGIYDSICNAYNAPKTTYSTLTLKKVKSKVKKARDKPNKPKKEVTKGKSKGKIEKMRIRKAERERMKNILKEMIRKAKENG